MLKMIYLEKKAYLKDNRVVYRVGKIYQLYDAL